MLLGVRGSWFGGGEVRGGGFQNLKVSGLGSRVCCSVLNHPGLRQFLWKECWFM